MVRREVFWIAIIVVLLGFSLGPAGKRQDEDYPNYRILATMLERIKGEYVEEVDSEELFKGALDGVIGTLDPYSQYLPPRAASELKVDTEGAYGGLGIQITVRDHQLTIITPIEDTPAFRAGIMAGDIIRRIDGVTTKGMTIQQAVDKLRGKPGSKVVLGILHEGARREVKITVERAKIHIHSVKGLERLHEGAGWNYWADPEAKIGYIRITQFQKKTVEAMDEIVDDLVNQGLKGLILDLRGNPGGLLNESIDMADRFVKEGLIVFTKGRSTEAYHEYTARADDDYPEFRTVVLVNGASASASEIVAGCLQDHNRGVIIGQRSFGKGSVQSIFDLVDNSELKLTTAHYYTPTGRNIHRTDKATPKDDWGVIPDITVKVSKKEQYALYLQRNRADVIRANGNGTTNKGEADPENPKKDETQTGVEKEKPPTPAPAPGPESKTKPETDPKDSPKKAGEDDAAEDLPDRQLLRAVEVLKDPEQYEKALLGPEQAQDAREGAAPVEEKVEGPEGVERDKNDDF